MTDDRLDTRFLSARSTDALSRRALLKAVGGLTFLALSPARGGFALSSAPPRAQPIFTALPYIQPGLIGGPVVSGQEGMTIAWQTDNLPADFAVQIDGRDALRPSVVERMSGDDGEMRFNYAAVIRDLPAGKRCPYRVRMDGKTIAEGFFTTRKPRGVKTRFVAFGDNSYGDISDRNIAYRVFLARPEFVMNTGDNVYEDGADNEYARHFFPTYNATTLETRVGAPLLRSVPFYTVLGNHDVHAKDAKLHPIADFVKLVDSLAYFTNMHLPLDTAKSFHAIPMAGEAGVIAHFKAAAGERFPNMANYSYDFADAHFLCLDSNLYVDPNSIALQAWIESDLSRSDAAWKFVVFHHPPFNVGADHYAEQHMRVLSPIFEKCGVAMVLSGHEHNYQRTVPIRFSPKDTALGSNLGEKKRHVPGVFRLDRRFDGVTNTVPDGVIYLTTGAGGKSLYDVSMNNAPASWRHPEDNNINYIAAFISDRHSFTVFDMTPTSLDVAQIDQWGQEIDRFRIEKAR